MAEHALAAPDLLEAAGFVLVVVDTTAAGATRRSSTAPGLLQLLLLVARALLAGTLQVAVALPLLVPGRGHGIVSAHSRRQKYGPWPSCGNAIVHVSESGNT